jgi:cell division protein FtsL
MKSGDTPYAVKKDVRNNAIVREVDGARQRELSRWLVICTLLVGVVLFSAWQQFELLSHGYRLERLQEERRAEQEVNRHLRLEIESLRAPKRIERLAVEKLKLTAPGRDQAIVIERVIASEPPSRSVVASR